MSLAKWRTIQSEVKIVKVAPQHHPIKSSACPRLQISPLILNIHTYHNLNHQTKMSWSDILQVVLIVQGVVVVCVLAAVAVLYLWLGPEAFAAFFAFVREMWRNLGRRGVEEEAAEGEGEEVELQEIRSDYIGCLGGGAGLILLRSVRKTAEINVGG
ncbi:hypothetical protein BU16DRAFT_554162 [Lophium mytilinum]|uniref:Uncharacterized protein n=1 Tax=Lophium mytilinum TaxID=390894 RepID=A0A6A6RBB5_9PEZI|nr:hypothetical protein BU16DRAFT_554162 [Lophium mytilinum]